MESNRWEDRPPRYRARKGICGQALLEKAVGLPITLYLAACCLPRLGWMDHVSFPSNTLRNSPFLCLKALPNQVVAENVGPGARLPGFKSQLYHCLLV